MCTIETFISQVLQSSMIHPVCNSSVNPIVSKVTSEGNVPENGFLGVRSDLLNLIKNENLHKGLRQSKFQNKQTLESNSRSTHTCCRPPQKRINYDIFDVKRISVVIVHTSVCVSLVRLRFREFHRTFPSSFHKTSKENQKVLFPFRKSALRRFIYCNYGKR